MKNAGQAGCKNLRFLMYQATDEDVSVNAAIKDETMCPVQKGIAELFGAQKAAISKHIKNVFEEGESEEKMIVSILETTAAHGAIEGKIQHSATRFYSLDAISAWATT